MSEYIPLEQREQRLIHVYCASLLKKLYWTTWIEPFYWINFLETTPTIHAQPSRTSPVACLSLWHGRIASIPVYERNQCTQKQLEADRGYNEHPSKRDMSPGKSRTNMAWTSAFWRRETGAGDKGFFDYLYYAHPAQFQSHPKLKRDDAFARFLKPWHHRIPLRVWCTTSEDVLCNTMPPKSYPNRAADHDRWIYMGDRVYSAHYRAKRTLQLFNFDML